mmetsp:Transcript_66447/g.158546  ORF Transcript_66447/g.158546 Transcript_66447/m.158546 type:complete len:215 (+) Transcript_66447:494-1138(+)
MRFAATFCPWPFTAEAAMDHSGWRRVMCLRCCGTCCTKRPPWSGQTSPRAWRDAPPSRRARGPGPAASRRTWRGRRLWRPLPRHRSARCGHRRSARSERRQSRRRGRAWRRLRAWPFPPSPPAFSGRLPRNQKRVLAKMAWLRSTGSRRLRNGNGAKRKLRLHGQSMRCARPLWRSERCINPEARWRIPHGPPSVLRARLRTSIKVLCTFRAAL